MNLNFSLLHSDKGLFFFVFCSKKNQYGIVETALEMMEFSGITEDIDVFFFLISY